EEGGKKKKALKAGKGKGIVSDEQVTQSLLDLQKPKKKSSTDQYIFPRRTPATRDASTRPSAQPHHDTSTNVVCDTSSLVDSTNDADTVADMELSTSKVDIEILNVDEEHGEEVSHTVALEERIVEVYKLENHDLYSKIDKQVNKVIKEAVHNTIQAPLSERFRDLLEFQMKEILHDWMFKSGSYRSYPDHTTLYEALEVPCNMTIMMIFMKHWLHHIRGAVIIKILLYLLQRTLTKAIRKSRILMHLLQNSL
nr:hypothetical protein [Tanacetum cinerariifolium]